MRKTAKQREQKVVALHLEGLAAEWKVAKKAEEEARQTRVFIEEQIAAHFPAELKEEGAVSARAGKFKVTVTTKLLRSVDWDEFEELKDKIPANLQPVEYKPSLVLKGVRWLEENEPTLYRVFAKCLSVKPGKPYVVVKEAD